MTVRILTLTLFSILLCCGTALPQISKKPESGKVETIYRSKAIVAVLPGNPFDSRLYSLQWGVLNRLFFSELSHDYLITVSASTGPFVKYRPEASFEVAFEDSDSRKAEAVVKAIMDVVTQEMKDRLAADPSYGGVHVESPVRALKNSNGHTRASGVLTMDGPRWGDAEKRETKMRISALIATLSDLETLRAVASQGLSRGSRPDGLNEVARTIQSSIRFRNMNDSWIEVTLNASNPTFLARLLDYIPKEKIALSGRLSPADLDFVPSDMRNNWYVVNCCTVNPL
jgi:hypothetical protein